MLILDCVHCFQLGVLFNDIVGLYKYYNEFIANYIHENGESAANHYTIRYIIADVRSILKYFTMFIEKSKNRDEMTTQKIIQFIEVALLCYNNIPNCAKIPEVLSFLSCIVTKLQVYSYSVDSILQNGINSLIPNILDAVYGGTLSLISQDQINYPEIRLEFYNLLSCLAQYSFEKLFSFGVAQQQVLIDSILWGFKHDSREICETVFFIFFFLSFVEFTDYDQGLDECQTSFGRFQATLLQSFPH